MRKKRVSRLRPLPVAGIFSLVVFITLGAAFMLMHDDGGMKHMQQSLTHGAAPEQPVDMSKLSATERQAIRLQNRLAKDRLFTPPVGALVNALHEKKELLQRAVTVSFTAAVTGQPVPASWTISLTQHVDWIVFVPSLASPHYEVDEMRIADALSTGYFAQLPRPRDARVSNVNTDKFGVQRAVTDVFASTGYIYDTEHAAQLVANALAHGEQTVQWSVTRQEGGITYATGGSVYSLKLLASGLSDFSGSVMERTWNVHKVIDERMNNIVVKPGAVFHFVPALGGPVTVQSGWKEWLGLFGGGAALTPGAGICQGATTLYRAILLAGLPVVEKANHSLFVDHYEKYGIGVDATVFPGTHDFAFKNNTSGPLMMQGYINGNNVIINLYGISDGRSVTMEGPYFASTAKHTLVPFGRAGLNNFEIAWIRTVRNGDGSTKKEMLLSHYAKPLWHSLEAKYIGNDRSLKELTALAPSPIN